MQNNALQSPHLPVQIRPRKGLFQRPERHSYFSQQRLSRRFNPGLQQHRRDQHHAGDGPPGDLRRLCFAPALLQQQKRAAGDAAQQRAGDNL